MKTKEKSKVQRIPATTDARCAELGTTWNTCPCDNKQNTGGSYFCEIQLGDKVCKHQAHVRRAMVANQRPANEPPAGMIVNPAYTEWLFDHFTDKPMEAEPPKFIADPAAADPIIRAHEMVGTTRQHKGATIYTVDLEASRVARQKQIGLMNEAERHADGSPLQFQAAAKAVGSPAFVNSLTPQEVAAADAAVDAPVTAEPRPWLDAFVASDDDHIILQAEMEAEAAEYAAELGADNPLAPERHDSEICADADCPTCRIRQAAMRNWPPVSVFSDALDAIAGNQLAVTETLAALPRRTSPVAALLVSLRPQLDGGPRRSFG